jgi:hypothetical protein
MAGLTARDLLDIADEGHSLDWISRGLMLAASAWPHSSPEQCATLPIGVRDRLVMALRLQTFGRNVSLRFRCDACGSDLVARLDLGAILSAHGSSPPASVTIELNGETIEARLPTSEDLLATAGLPSLDGEWALYRRCLTSDTQVDATAIRQRIAQALAAADPLAALDVELACAECGARYSAPFDIVTCFWKEIEAAAWRAALDVHLLASAYGWSEEQVLSMSPARRARYLALRDQ